MGYLVLFGDIVQVMKLLFRKLDRWLEAVTIQGRSDIGPEAVSSCPQAVLKVVSIVGY